MTEIVTSPNNNGKEKIYTKININDLYRDLESIGAPNNLKYSSQHSQYFEYSNNNDIFSLKTVIVATHDRKNIVCECCGIIGDKSDSYIIRGPKCLPSSFKQNMNQYNDIHGDEPTETPREWNIKPP